MGERLTTSDLLRVTTKSKFHPTDVSERYWQEDCQAIAPKLADAVVDLVWLVDYLLDATEGTFENHRRSRELIDWALDLTDGR